MLELSIAHNASIQVSSWESVMWALVCAAARLLQIPESELGGTTYRSSVDTWSILLYDNVPGGAGHTYQLKSMVPELIRESYHVVDGHCGCGESTCCYGCIANYYNQPIQHKLSRGEAKRVLGVLLGLESIDDDVEHIDECRTVSTQIDADIETAAREDGGFDLRIIDEGATPDIIPFADSCRRAIGGNASREWYDFLTELGELGAGRDLELPYRDVEFCDNRNNAAFASLTWKESRVILLDEESEEDFADAFGDSWQDATNWKAYTPLDIGPAEFIELLEEDQKWHA